MDNILLFIISYVRSFPTYIISFINYIICIGIIVFLNRKYKYIGLGCYVVICNIISNLQFVYPIQYFGMPTLLGTVVFSSTFLAVDIINHEYGNKIAKQVVYINLYLNIFFLLNIILTLGHAPDRNSILGMSKNINAFETIFTPSARILLSSYVAYLIAQLVEISLLRKIGKTTLGHNISLFISSIIIDNFLFTVLSLFIFNHGIIQFSSIAQVTFSAIVLRVICNYLNSISYKLIIKH